MSTTKRVTKKAPEYSVQYQTIKKAAESKWPTWKVTVYNTSIATSVHAKKVAP